MANEITNNPQEEIRHHRSDGYVLHVRPDGLGWCVVIQSPEPGEPARLVAQASSYGGFDEKSQAVGAMRMLRSAHPMVIRGLWRDGVDWILPHPMPRLRAPRRT